MKGDREERRVGRFFKATGVEGSLRNKKYITLSDTSGNPVFDAIKDLNEIADDLKSDRSDHVKFRNYNNERDCARIRSLIQTSMQAGEFSQLRSADFFTFIRSFTTLSQFRSIECIEPVRECCFQTLQRLMEGEWDRLAFNFADTLSFLYNWHFDDSIEEDAPQTLHLNRLTTIMREFYTKYLSVGLPQDSVHKTRLLYQMSVSIRTYAALNVTNQESRRFTLAKILAKCDLVAASLGQDFIATADKQTIRSMRNILEIYTAVVLFNEKYPGNPLMIGDDLMALINNIKMAIVEEVHELNEPEKKLLSILKHNCSRDIRIENEAQVWTYRVDFRLSRFDRVLMIELNGVHHYEALGGQLRRIDLLRQEEIMALVRHEQRCEVEFIQIRATDINKPEQPEIMAAIERLSQPARVLSVEPLLPQPPSQSNLSPRLYMSAVESRTKTPDRPAREESASANDPRVAAPSADEIKRSVAKNVLVPPKIPQKAATSPKSAGTSPRVEALKSRKHPGETSAAVKASVAPTIPHEPPDAPNVPKAAKGHHAQDPPNVPNPPKMFKAHFAQNAPKAPKVPKEPKAPLKAPPKAYKGPK